MKRTETTEKQPTATVDKKPTGKSREYKVNIMVKKLLVWALMMSAVLVNVAFAVTVGELRCEYLRDPLGLDVVKPRFSWILQSNQRNEVQKAYRVIVASSPGLLAKDQGDLWDSGKVLSDESAQVEYGGRSLTSRQSCWWKVRVWNRVGHASPWSDPARWEMGLLKPEDWQAKWIDAPLTAVPPESSHEVAAKEGSTPGISGSNQSLPYLRKDFTLSKGVAKARLYVTALGLYEIHLNGQRVGDHIFAPDWTDYNKRVRYQVYDVTSLVKSGDNTLGTFVGNGWYSGHIGNGGFQAWGKKPALFAQLEVTALDGSVDRIVTDASWKIHAGPILSSDMMMGESYDAQKEITGWDQPGLDTRDWSNASERAEADRPLDGQIDQPVRKTGELHPNSISEPKPGHWTFDLGQNMVGFVRLKVSAPAGTKIQLRHAEMLNTDGTIYTANLRGAPSIDTYICKGGGVELWQPRFTFHGFRYVELTGLPQAPGKEAVTGIVVGTDIPRTGQFSCSNPDINKLQSNIQWGMRGNYLSVPTDCPQRDERMGWMGDAQVFIRTAAFNGDIASFFTKWLVDVDDAQNAYGEFTNVSPSPVGKGNGDGVAPAWGDAGVICPWTIYLMYGDKRILEQHLAAMTRWVDWCREHSTNLIRDHDRGHDYGDWLSQGENTQKELIGTAFFAYSTSIVAKACHITGNDAAAGKYQQLFEQIKAAFNQRYVQADGHIQNATQTDYCMALKFNLLPDDLRVKAAQYLADDVVDHKNHLTTGFIGVSYLLPALCSEDQVDTAYRVFLQDTFPSWLFSVKKGATTIWERWDGWTPNRGFQNPGMNSFNHYSLGSCGEWMFDTVAGIGLDPDHPGFKHIIIRPRPGGNLTSAECSYASIHGLISTKWILKNGNFSLNVTIPPNTTATIELPTENLASVEERAGKVATDPGIHPAENVKGNAQYEIGSGTYNFTCKVVLNGAQTNTISLKNIPYLGKSYDVQTAPGSAVLTDDGKVVLEAKGK